MVVDMIASGLALGALAGITILMILMLAASFREVSHRKKKRERRRR
jgi:hypothetical protein